MQDRYTEVSGNLRDLYDDKHVPQKEELRAISGPIEFAELCNRLKQIKEFHQKHPNEFCVLRWAELVFRAPEDLRESKGRGTWWRSQTKKDMIATLISTTATLRVY